MCLASMSDYDRETQRQICALEQMLTEKRRKELLLDAGIRARSTRFMPAAAVEANPCVEAVASGTQLGEAA